MVSVLWTQTSRLFSWSRLTQTSNLPAESQVLDPLVPGQAFRPAASHSAAAFTDPLGSSLSDKGSSPFLLGPLTSSHLRLPKNIPNKKTPNFFFPLVHIP